MTEVKCIEISGLKLWFPSGDHHPPHFHAVRKDRWKMRVFFQELAVDEMFKEDKRSKRKVRSKEKKLLAKRVIEHRIELLREWEQVHLQ